MGQGADERAGADRDADAPWRPGYEGSPSTEPADVRAGGGADPAAVAGAGSTHDQPAGHAGLPGDAGQSAATSSPASSPVRRRVAVAAAVTLLIAAGLLAWSRWSGDDVATDEGRAPAITRSGELAWTATLEDEFTKVAAGNGVVVFATPVGADIWARDVETGDVLWAESAVVAGVGVAALVVVGDRVVAEQRSPSRNGVLTAFDSRTGAAVWNTDPARAGSRLVATAGEPALLQHRDEGDSGGFDLLDPSDGSIVGSAAGLSSVTTPDRSLTVAPSAGRVALWSPDEHRFITGPVSDFNLRDIGAIDGGAVGFDTEGRIVAFDQAGNRTDELQFLSEASGRLARRPALVGVRHDERFGIMASGSSVGFQVEAGSLAVVWEIEGYVGRPVTTERGVFSLVLANRNDFLVDVSSGNGVLDLGPAAPGTRRILLGHDGFLAGTLTEPAERILEAFDYEGMSLWSRPIPDRANIYVVEGFVVIVGEDDVVVLR